MGKNGDKDSRPKKKTRGPSTGKTFEEILSNQENAEDQGKNEKNEKKEKLYIDFNELGQPYGQWLKKFRSDMGKLARNIRIIKSWKDVTNGEKTTMWRCAKKTWNLEDDKKKFILRVVRNRFKDWKTRMTSTYIFPKQKTDDGEEKSDDGEEKSDDGEEKSDDEEEKSDDGEVAIKSPVGKYTQLTQEDWDEFVKQRMTADFQEKRKKAQNAQKQNVHPHYLGRAGYVGKQDKWYVEELTKEAQNQPNKDLALTQKTVVERLSDRGYAWIKAHTPPTSAEPPTKLQKVIDEYGIWKEKEEKGEFVPSRFEDALVKALGKPEHTGRTRGVGGCVGLQTYFGKPPSRDNRGKRYTDDDIKLLIEKAKSEAMEQMNKLMEKKIAEALSNGGKVFISDATLKDLPKNHSPDEHDHSSCHSTHHSDPFIELKERVPCRLAVIEDGEVTVAAHGMVSPWVEGKKVHNTPLTMQNAQVSIDEVIKAGARLPCPWNGFSKIGEVEGSFAQWPKTLILLGEDEADKGEKTRKRKAKSKDTKESGNKVQKKATSLEMDKGKQHRGEEDERAPLSVEEVKALSYHCQILEQKLCSLSTTACIKIVIDVSTFNYQENNNDIECYLTVVEIRQMFRYLWLNVVMLQAWESFLYQCATTIETTKLVAYLCPVKLVEYMHNSKQCEAYIAHAMKIQEEKKYIMGAFHEGNHWMLVVICVGLNTMYILDSRKRDPKKMDIKKVLEGAWVLYCAYGGRRNYNNKSTKVYIKEIRCPQQPEDYECGYYVMKWMYDITFYYCKVPEIQFEQNIATSPMSMIDMNMAREVWANKCLDNIHLV